MKTQDFTVINNLVIGVTTVAFSQNVALISLLQNLGFKEVLTNVAGKRFSQDELVTFLSKCDVAIVGLDRIDGSVLSQTPKLKAIAKYGVGLDNIDLGDCLKYNVKILHKSGVNRRSVSEMTLGFMLGLTRNLFVTSNLLNLGTWHKDGGIQLSGKTIGIIGVGNIGKDLVSLLKPFNCQILVNDIINQDEYYLSNDLVAASKDFIFKNADIITVHTPLDSSTRDMINLETFSMMKPSAFLINTARSGIVNQNDLKIALRNKIISGAAIDVYDSEPPLDKELLSLENLVNTPHIGGNSMEAVEAMGMAAINNLTGWISKH